MLHNHYQIRGGEDESFHSEVNMLRERGHEVGVYTETNDSVAQLGVVRTGIRTTWSQPAYETVRKLLRTGGFDILHVQNFFPLLSPSVYYAARAEGVPVVQTLRNYRLACPNAIFFRDGHVCEDCNGKVVPWPGILHGCYRGSVAATTAVALMGVTHRAVRTWHSKVDVYVALTEFARRKYVENGFPAEKIVVKPNFVFPDPGLGSHEGSYALYVGRLTPEKGLGTLLRAWEKLGTRFPLKIVGDGPMATALQSQLGQVTGVEWLGRQPITEVHRLMGDASLLVFPSEWYETFGRVAVEAFAKGTPVVASRLGAVEEVVRDGITGLHFTPGDVEDLVSKVEWLLAHPDQMREMGTRARQEYEALYTSDQNYQQLINIYHLAQKQAGVWS